MPAVHVFGEILGASGLTHEDALSLGRVVDLLSLHPSSRRSFFCRWRVQLEGVAPNDPFGASDAWSTTWEVLDGDAHGQTQVHSPADSVSVPVSLYDMNSSQSTDHVLLDVVWSHPIDLHMASTAAFRGWPHLELQVWSLDCLNQAQLCGAASVCIPSASGEYLVDVPLVRAVPSSWVQRITEHLAVPIRNETRHADLRGHKATAFADVDDWRTADTEANGDDFSDGEWPLGEPGGTVFTRLAVLQSGV
ncbi:hypothetical protein PybrP1_001357 [[Pythium] brassicae (nom. inval.)]|nr:hypothetical protein PybrP1_001357 [[Pythium] brassicae (nom. inval.)]